MKYFFLKGGKKDLSRKMTLEKNSLPLIKSATMVSAICISAQISCFQTDGYFITLKQSKVIMKIYKTKSIVGSVT